MGLVKAWLMDQADKERRNEVREWLRDRLGREPTEKQIDKYWDEFELHEAYEHAASKDD